MEERPCKGKRPPKKGAKKKDEYDPRAGSDLPAIVAGLRAWADELADLYEGEEREDE